MSLEEENELLRNQLETERGHRQADNEKSNYEIGKLRNVATTVEISLMGLMKLIRVTLNSDEDE